jgi:hypothetical protein
MGRLAGMAFDGISGVEGSDGRCCSGMGIDEAADLDGSGITSRLGGGGITGMDGVGGSGFGTPNCPPARNQFPKC